MKQIYCLIGIWLCTFSAIAQSETNDSIKTQELNEVFVEAQMQRTDAKKSTYIPTVRQKNASQTGADLLDQMSIPQLNITLSGNIQTNSGKEVAVFIDYIPASENDLKAMRISDVKRVEYYEYPSDPRLQGHQFVVNYIMAKYEYGGYVKLYDHTNLLHFSEQLLGNVRLQYKNMTYDLMGYGWGHNSSHYGSELTETYRLPQEDGAMKIFDRYSNTTSSKENRQQYFAAFKATYNTDKIQASTQFNGSINRKPHSDRTGEVIYSPADFPASEYSSTLNNITKFLSYNGYYFFALPKSNSISFTPFYMFSHTEQNSSYIENGFAPIYNGAIDNSNQLKADLKFNHDFGKYGNLLGFIRGSYEYNRTQYTGSATSLDRAKSSRVGVGATYNVSIGNFYGSTGFGWDWDKLRFADIVDNPSSPWFDLSLQYGFKDKHSLSTTFHYSTWAPSPTYKSENIIQSTPLLRYTGNPNLVPSKSYDIDFRYTWLPNNNYSLSAFAWAWIVGDRYAYDYEATSDGVLRTIKQPMGSFAQGQYGVSGTLRFLNRTLVFSGQVAQLLNHNGTPYNVNHSSINWYTRVRYYLKDWNFTLTYISDNASADGMMNGIWQKSKNDWYITVGWSNSNWNVRADLIDFSRWNWKSATQEMHSKYYDTFQQFYDGQSHALIQLSATYTFGFGKKVQRDNEPGVSGSASSGILQ
ncbi:MAG: outer membrane beta-barrel family protein [Muribaculaceae bacterium]|nr:outer membrane beta-barrel family protein [Muribaculaceae bacterium]